MKDPDTPANQSPSDPAATPSVLGGALRDGRRDVALGASLVTVHQVAEVLVPVTIGVIIDRAVRPGDTASMGRWIAVLAVQFVVLSAAGCIGVYVEERARMRATHRVRTCVAEWVLHPAGGTENALAGEVLSLSTIETTRIGEGVGAVILGIGGITGILAGAAILLTMSWSLGLLVIIGLPMVLIVVDVLAAPLVKRADTHQTAVGRAAGIAADLFAGLRVLKGLGAEAAASAHYRKASADALGAALTANRVRSIYAGFTLTIAGTFVILVAWIGGRQALAGTISVGQLVAAFGVTTFLVGPLGRLGLAGNLLAQARASSAHVAEALEAPPAVVAGTATLPASVRGAFEVVDLHHGSLRGVAFVIEHGELVGVVAANPADAAALVSCLDRSVDPVAGSVRVDSQALGSLTLDDARRAVLVADHDAPLFGGSLADNIGSGAPPGADLDRAVVGAGADEVIALLSGGLAAAVHEDGRSLSGGQRQRVALARALAVDAPVLVLHEPTTAVDAATEHRIAAGVARARAGRTTLVIAASPTLLAAADRVILIDEGAVVAEGSHRDLIANNARYRQAVLT